MNSVKTASKRYGFTLVEVVIALVIVALLTNIALPAMSGAKTKARAAAVVGHFNTIRAASYSHFADTGRYPRSSGWGTVPPEFVPILPDNFSFDVDGVRYRWRRWSTATGRRRSRRASRPLVAVQVRVSSGDRALMKAIRGIWRGEEWRGNNTRTTLVIE